LSIDEKTIILIHYKYNLTTSEISEILNMNKNTLKSKLLRTKHKIEKKIGGDIYETK